MIPGSKMEIAVELAPADRERLDRVPELLRRIELMEARASATSATAAADPVYLAPKKFAARWDVSERAVRGWIAEGLPVATCGARLVRINVAGGDEWVRSRRTP